MTKKTVGYVELEWICPNCGARNPGSVKSCLACGAPQPENVQFEQPQDAGLLEDDAKIDSAKKGPDIHCPYCGTRNPGDALTCIQCGGDLVEGMRRASGQVIGAFSPEAAPLAPVICPACGTENPASNKTCSACGANLAAQPDSARLPGKQPAKKKKLWLLIPLIAFILLCCGLVFGFAFRTNQSTGLVRDVAWERSIIVQEFGDVTLEAWRDELPQGAAPLSCKQELRSTVDEPVAGAKEICGTPYSVDTGSGFAEVVQDCKYEVYEDYCKYTAREWKDGETLVAEGQGYDPYWPALQLGAGQREGERAETYRVFFETDDGIKEFTTSDENLFAQLQPGTQWTLEMNLFGAVVSVRR
ncbi:MAG: zinc ribbon domain-containing protein [Anaerolineales bacterium]|jgi:ribosomal protein L40E|nr:zinc ribbon domain-containing protein [Anaerolineales bacterium]